MSLSKVYFATDYIGRDEALYDRDKLFLGASVHVTKHSANTTYSPDPSDDSTVYYVTWIAPSEWYVELRQGAAAQPRDAHCLHSVLDGETDTKTIDRALAFCASLIPGEKQFLTSARETNPVDQIVTVAERLSLVKLLSVKSTALNLVDHYEPLVIHLLMTCFDRLGQPADWLSFPSWLDQKTTKALSISSATPVDIAKELYRIWAAEFGVRNSFYRFLKEVLPAPDLTELLASIEIHKATTPPEIKEVDVTDEDKMAWLYETRNRYTHNVQAIKGLHPEHFGTPSPHAQSRGYRIERNTWTNYSVKGWPDAVTTAVRKGLKCKVEALAAGRSF